MVYQVEFIYLQQARNFLCGPNVLAMDQNKTISLHELIKAERIVQNYLLYYPQGKVHRVREK